MKTKLIAFSLVLILIFSAVPSLGEEITLNGYSKAGFQYVSFGRYPTGKNGDVTPILWRVLSVDGTKAYLLSEYVLFAAPVQSDSARYAGWEKSDLCAYLNQDFLNEAFSPAEQAALAPCPDVEELVTLLSSDEVKNASIGFINEKSRLCESTDWAKRSRPENKKLELNVFGPNHRYSPWWTRTVSTDKVTQQRRLIEDGKIGRYSVSNPDSGVRPAINIDLRLLIVTDGSGRKDAPYVLECADHTDIEAKTTEPVPTEDSAEDAVDNAAKDTEKEDTGSTRLTLLDDDREISYLDEPPVDDAATDVPAEPAEPTKSDEPAEPTAPKEEAKPAEPAKPADTKESTEPIEPEEPTQEETPSGDVFSAAADPQYIHPKFPTLTKEGFLPDGEDEFVLQDDENGLWLYATQTLRIQIERFTGTNEKKQPLRWYEARVFTRDASEHFDLYPFDQEKFTNPYTLELADKIALKNHLVFGINSDYFIYRVGRDKEEKQKNPNNLIPIGIEIRDGELLYSSPKKATSEVYPPLDYLVFYEDGSVKGYANTINGDARERGKAGQELAGEWIRNGATDCLSFGPLLVENGEVSPRSSMYGSTPNPRTAFGYVEKGHYICVMVESRTAESKGESCIWLGQKMAELGCTEAMNLDGGATSTMIFMGKQINKSGNYGDITNRKQNELLGIGISDKVGN